MDQLAEYRARHQQRFAEEQKKRQTEPETAKILPARELELEVLREINQARTDPKGCASRLRAQLDHFRGNEYFPQGRQGKIVVVTKEGAAAVHDALAFLEQQPPVPPLAPENVRMLRLAAEDHVADLGPKGIIGHKSSDGSSSSQRIARYGRWFGKCGENLWFGREGSTAAQVVENLIIDDGVPSRGHRLGIFDPQFQRVGICAGPHKTFGSCVVMDFAEQCYEDAQLANMREFRGPRKISPSREVKTQWDLGACRGCGEPIHGGSVVEALGGKWHKSCFACAGCQISLVGVPYRDVKGSLFCKSCEKEQSSHHPASSSTQEPASSSTQVPSPGGAPRVTGARTAGSAGLRAASAVRAARSTAASEQPPLPAPGPLGRGQLAPLQPSKRPLQVRTSTSVPQRKVKASMVLAKKTLDESGVSYGNL